MEGENAASRAHVCCCCLLFVGLTIADVDDLLHDDCQTGVEQVGCIELRLELGASGEDQTGDVGPILRDEQLRGHLCHLSQIVVSLLQTKTSETKGGLSTAAVLLRQVDAELVNHSASVA